MYSRHTLIAALAVGLTAGAWTLGARAENLTEPRTPQEAECQKKAWAAGFAATMRDAQATPQEAFDRLHDLRSPHTPDTWLKAVINAIFFAPDVKDADSNTIYAGVAMDCMGMTKRAQPLQ
ncbi:MAG: hypothetical protein KGH75_05880 [Rhodospirillales bacterium]|nr:hypothetical protein [Rhodospirillales bacterium]